jgi:hypothetical protein
MKTDPITLPPGVADAWFHIHCGGETYVSRICRGRDLLKVLDEIAPDLGYAEDLADQDRWYVLNGQCVGCSLACGEDPDIQVTLIDEGDLRSATGDPMTWEYWRDRARRAEALEMGRRAV